MGIFCDIFRTPFDNITVHGLKVIRIEGKDRGTGDTGCPIFSRDSKGQVIFGAFIENRLDGLSPVSGTHLFSG